MIQEYRPELSGVTQARVLLVGPVGAGKSSFFNSINSLFRGHMTSQAISGVCGKSVTTQVRNQRGGFNLGGRRQHSAVRNLFMWNEKAQRITT